MSAVPIGEASGDEQLVAEVRDRLRGCFRDVDDASIDAAIRHAVRETADARIQTFRSLLVARLARSILIQSHRTEFHDPA